MPNEFLQTTLEAYVLAATATQMLKTLMKNSTLESLTALDPSFNRHTIVKEHLELLSDKCPHLLNGTEGKLKDEIRVYAND